MLNGGVVYQIDCSGWGASYVGKTNRHFATRLSEHLKRTSPLGEHLLNCVGHTKDARSKIVDKTRFSDKLLSLKAIYIAQLDPQLNTREEYAQRHLTLKL